MVFNDILCTTYSPWSSSSLLYLIILAVSPRMAKLDFGPESTILTMSGFLLTFLFCTEVRCESGLFLPLLRFKRLILCSQPFSRVRSLFLVVFGKVFSTSWDLICGFTTSYLLVGTLIFTPYVISSWCVLDYIYSDFLLTWKFFNFSIWCWVRVWTDCVSAKHNWDFRPRVLSGSVVREDGLMTWQMVIFVFNSSGLSGSESI